jgi:hypothetical protein
VTTGPTNPLPPWPPDQLRQRHHQLKTYGIGNKYYSKAEVDQLLAHVLGSLQGMTERIEKAETTRNRALDDLRAYTAEHPDHITVPLQAQAMMERTQEECDAYVTSTREYCEALIGDAKAHAETLMDELPENEVQGVTIGGLPEPGFAGEDVTVAEVEAYADWIDNCGAYLVRRREELDVGLRERIERLSQVHDRVTSRSVAAP